MFGDVEVVFDVVADELTLATGAIDASDVFRSAIAPDDEQAIAVGCNTTGFGVGCDRTAYRKRPRY